MLLGQYRLCTPCEESNATFGSAHASLVLVLPLYLRTPFAANSTVNVLSPKKACGSARVLSAANAVFPPYGSHPSTIPVREIVSRLLVLGRSTFPPYSSFGDAAYAFSVALLRSVVATQTFKLPLAVVQFAFRKMEHERDVDEIECLLANLIFRVRAFVPTLSQEARRIRAGLLHGASTPTTRSVYSIIYHLVSLCITLYHLVSPCFILSYLGSS